jgi:hypothetical protein
MRYKVCNDMCGLWVLLQRSRGTAIICFLILGKVQGLEGEGGGDEGGLLGGGDFGGASGWGSAFGATRIKEHASWGKVADES